MSREEEIKQAAQAYYPSGSLYEYCKVPAFVRGAKWADENQPGMTKMRKDYELLFLLKKQELIKKACEWLDENIDAYSKVIIAENSIPTIVLTEDFEFRFKKAMEE